MRTLGVARCEEASWAEWLARARFMQSSVPLPPEVRMVSTTERAAAITEQLRALMAAMAAEELTQKARIDAVLPQHRMSALNLAHYLALRKQDVHRLQLELAAVGLSSLGRCEGHVRDTLERLSAWLAGDRDLALACPHETRLDCETAEAILHANTAALLGPRPPSRHVRILVTAPDASEVTPAWADELLEAGADLLRINAAHGTPAEWKAIATTFKARAAARGMPGRVLVDLPGPKLRTQVTRLEELVAHVPRQKDARGRTVAPSPVELVAAYAGGAQLPVPPTWLDGLEPGDVIELTDAGGRDRVLRVAVREGALVRASCERSLYIASGLPLQWRRGTRRMGSAKSGPMPLQPAVLRLGVGDTFLLNESGLSDDGTIALAFPEAALLAEVRPGQRVLLDDGKLIAVAEAVRADGLLCRVRYAPASSTRLRSGKGIAFPDSTLSLGELGPQDDLALAFALEHADGVGVSFVSSAHDVSLVGERIRAADQPGFAMILKLETRGAVHNLAAILFEALKYQGVGLMIARGDLAVELSFERLAEMQEEILWFGEACHLPVVWATQVLDGAARTGVPTRAEVTDAAMSMRAECVMLNKGPYIAMATRLLADIICKMEAHQYKKRSLYRQLSVARGGPRSSRAPAI